MFILWGILYLRHYVLTAYSEAKRWAHAQPIIRMGISAFGEDSLISKLGFQDIAALISFTAGVMYLLPISYHVRLIWYRLATALHAALRACFRQHARANSAA